MTPPPARQVVPVNLGERSYEIVIGSGLLQDFSSLIEPWCVRLSPTAPPRRAAVVTDQHVLPHANKVVSNLQSVGWTIKLITLEPGEAAKKLEIVAGIYDRLVDLGADRRTPLMAVGGGVIGDAAGFAAATFNRGIPFIQVPTTLLAHVDSSVGGKVGVNHPRAKNLIGAFHQPLGVVIDTQVLETLPDRDYRSGLAEVVKYGVILDAKFFSYLEEHVSELNLRDPETLRAVIARSCRLKADVVERDEFERTGLRAVLNYGHTFAHAYEALCGYGTLLHGEAVSIGMVAASRLAERLGRISTSVTERQISLLQALQLPIALPLEQQRTPDEWIAAMRLDKKTEAGQLRFVLPNCLGHVELVSSVSESDVQDVLIETAASRR